MDTAPVAPELAFIRARKPEQKQQRYAAILDAARQLALRDGVGALSLGAIATRIGMHKTALLKYFDTGKRSSSVSPRPNGRPGPTAWWGS